MKVEKPPVRPNEILRYHERTCAACGNPFRCLFVPGKPPRRLCGNCRKGGR